MARRFRDEDATVVALDADGQQLAALAAAVVFLPAGLALKKLSAVLLTKVGLNPVEQTSMQALELSVSLGQKIVFGIAALLMAPSSRGMHPPVPSAAGATSRLFRSASADG